MIVKDVDVALPILFVMVQVVQEFLIICITLTNLLFLLVIIAIIALANRVSDHLFFLVHVYVSAEPLYINDLTLAFLANLANSLAMGVAVLTIVLTLLEELFLGTNDFLAQTFLFKALVDQLTELD